MVRLGWSVDEGPPTLLREGLGMLRDALLIAVAVFIFLVLASGVPV